MGLFAIPEMLETCIEGTSIADVSKESMRGRREGVKDVLREWKLVLSSSGNRGIHRIFARIGQHGFYLDLLYLVGDYQQR